MRLITIDDFTELYFKIRQRGLSFILSKFNVDNIERTKSTFSDSYVESSNWWIIPRVRERWNFLITGKKDREYESYVVQKYLSKKQNLTMLSLGCGTGSHELRFATFNNFSHIEGIDIADSFIEKANEKAKQSNLDNIIFKSVDVNQMELAMNKYDIVLFHSSLHHFNNLENLLKDRVIPALKKDGLLILNDYWGPNRLQWSNNQLQEVNRLLKEMVPAKYRKRFKSTALKRKIYGPGWLRMVLSDPSEAVEAEEIKPLLRKYFNTLEEKNVGGNILMLLFKDIAHHFLNNDKQTEKLLDNLFLAEDIFLEKELEDSLLFFGVYTVKG